MAIKIVVVDKLGAMCAFKPKEIQVLRSVYDSIPEEKKEDFEEQLRDTRDCYQKKVDEARSRGEKPKSAQFKSEAISEVVDKWLSTNGIQEEKVKIVRSSNPRIPKDVPEVQISEEEQKEMEGIYENYPTEALEDDRPEKVEENSLDEGFFEGDAFEDEDDLEDLLGEATSLFEDDSEGDKDSSPEEDIDIDDAFGEIEL